MCRQDEAILKLQLSGNAFNVLDAHVVWTVSQNAAQSLMVSEWRLGLNVSMLS